MPLPDMCLAWGLCISGVFKTQSLCPAEVRTEGGTHHQHLRGNTFIMACENIFRSWRGTKPRLSENWEQPGDSVPGGAGPDTEGGSIRRLISQFILELVLCFYDDHRFLGPVLIQCIFRAGGNTGIVLKSYFKVVPWRMSLASLWPPNLWLRYLLERVSDLSQVK